jgi:hypothetical protein
VTCFADAGKEARNSGIERYELEQSRKLPKLQSAPLTGGTHEGSPEVPKEIAGKIFLTREEVSVPAPSEEKLARARKLFR